MTQVWTPSPILSSGIVIDPRCVEQGERVQTDESGTDFEAETGSNNRYRRVHARLHRNPAVGLVTKVVVTIVGFVVLATGLVMMVAPGPGIVGILLGLAILATEWVWAERLLQTARRGAEAAAAKAAGADPAVRRKRLLITAVMLLVVGGLVTVYVWYVGWPDFVVDAWDWVQGLSDLVPELPGM
jgi:uncharacterized protein (TIGR02611 family)